MSTLEIRKDIDDLAREVLECKSSVPSLVLHITARLKDDLNEKKISRNEYSNEAKKVVSLTGRFESHCKCSEITLFIPKIPVSTPPIIKAKAIEFDTTIYEKK
jgi:hypothetical protein